MGLLDGLFNPTADQEGLLSLLPLLTARKGDNSLALALQNAAQQRQGMQTRKQQEELRRLQIEQQQMQMQQMRQQQADQDRMRGIAGQFFQPGAPAQEQMGPTPDGSQMPMGLPTPPKMDYAGYANAMAPIDPMKALGLQSQLAQMNQKESFTLKPGEKRYQGDKVVADGGPESKPPGTLRHFDSGAVTYTQEWDGKAWNTIGKSPKFKPDGPEKPEKPPQGYRLTPDGNLSFIPGGPADPSVGKKEAAPTEDERRSAGLAIRMNSALKSMQEKPDSMSPEKLPEAVRAMTGGRLEALPNTLTSKNRQQVEAAQLDALDAALTLATGAAYTKEQLQNLRKSYFPQLGDAEETKKAKAEKLAEIIQTARIRAGRAEGSIDQVSAPAQGVAGGDTKKIPLNGRMMDAKRAPDGNYYIKSGDKYYRVEDR